MFEHFSTYHYLFIGLSNWALLEKSIFAYLIGQKRSNYLLENILVLARILLIIFENSKIVCSNSLGLKIVVQNYCLKD